MDHWYAYHSDSVMKHSYASVGASQLYLTKRYSFAIGDIVWVVEGDLNRPKGFALVDCFRCAEVEYPPFHSGYERFKLKIVGRSSLLACEIPLTKMESWFATLHADYITKRRSFSLLTRELEIVNGLSRISGIRF